MIKTVQEALQIPSKEEVRRWIRTTSEVELDQFINSCSASNNYWVYATAERQRRQLAKLTKPHWTVVWTFVLVILSIILAALAWIFPR